MLSSLVLSWKVMSHEEDVLRSVISTQCLQLIALALSQRIDGLSAMSSIPKDGTVAKCEVGEKPSTRIMMASDSEHIASLQN